MFDDVFQKLILFNCRTFWTERLEIGNELWKSEPWTLQTCKFLVCYVLKLASCRLQMFLKLKMRNWSHLLKSCSFVKDQKSAKWSQFVTHFIHSFWSGTTASADGLDNVAVNNGSNLKSDLHPSKGCPHRQMKEFRENSLFYFKMFGM